MFRYTLLLGCLVTSVAWAEPPLFSRGAVVLGLNYGPGMWNLDRAQLASQVGEVPAAVFTSQALNSHTATISLGYNILGHASLTADLTGTGWNLDSSARGGGGFLVGMAHWHPLELVWNREARPVPVDAHIGLGGGYGIAGQDLGMDGLVLQASISATYFIAKSVGVGLFGRGVFLQWDKLYFDYDNRITAPLPKGSGGTFWTAGLTLDCRFET